MIMAIFPSFFRMSFVSLRAFHLFVSFFHLSLTLIHLVLQLERVLLFKDLLPYPSPRIQPSRVGQIKIQIFLKPTSNTSYGNDVACDIKEIWAHSFVINGIFVALMSINEPLTHVSILWCMGNVR
jgi:hypothetical protein